MAACATWASTTTSPHVLELDEAGFVTRYPGLAERVAPET